MIITFVKKYRQHAKFQNRVLKILTNLTVVDLIINNKCYINLYIKDNIIILNIL